MVNKKIFRTGISPVVSVTLLILISLVVSLAIYAFVSGYVATPGSTQGGVAILTPETYFWDGFAVIVLRNDGNAPAIIDSAYVKVGNDWVPVKSNAPLEIKAGESKALIMSTKNLNPGTYLFMASGPGAKITPVKINVPVKVYDDYIGLVTGVFSKYSPLKPVTGYYMRLYDIRSLPTVPSVNDILSLSDDKVIYEGYVQSIDFTDNPAYGGSPWPSGQTDRFAAVIEASILLDKPSYISMDVITDDGVHVEIDGEVVLDSWKLQSPTQYAVTTYLSEGAHTLRVIYFENYGTARLKVSLKASESGSRIMSIHAIYFETDGEGASPSISKIMNGEYPKLLEKDEDFIDYTDTASYGGVPWPEEIGVTDTFAAHWIVTFKADVACNYVIRTYNDDGVMVYVDGQTIIDDWHLHAPSWNTGEIYLTKGEHRIDILYYENTGIARMYFEITPSDECLSATYDEVSTTYSATVYDLSGWSDWTQAGLDEMQEKMLNDELPKVGEYRVTYINFSDNTQYPGEEWFFTSDRASTDDFGVVFKGSIELPYPALLRIDTVSDDGIRVWLDGEVVFEDWTLHAPREATVEIAVGEGTHEIVIAYFEHTGIARLAVTLYAARNDLNVYPLGGNTVVILFSPPGPGDDYKVTVMSETNLVVGHGKVSANDTRVEIPVSQSLAFKGGVSIWG